MSSPFKLFRKHQKEMLIGVFIMAMLAFVVGDPLMKMFQGRGGEGADAAGATVVTIGKEDLKLTRGELQQLRNRRRVVNTFIERAMRDSLSPEMFPLGKINAEYGAQQLRAEIGKFMFQFLPPSRDYSIDRDVVAGLLLQKEAKRMGIVVSDEQINAYIDRCTRGGLSKRKFNRIVSELQSNPPINAPRLYDYLRDELMARMASNQLFFKISPAPEQYWDFYKRLHESQKVEAIVVPTADFVSQIKDPDNDQPLIEYFDKHKNLPDADAESYTVSFYQPDKIRVQYLRRKFSDIEATVAQAKPVTDKDIAEYYEKHKSNYEAHAPSFPDIDPRPGQPKSTSEPLNPLITPDKSGKKPGDPSLPLELGPIPGADFTAPGGKAPATKAPEKKQPAASTPEKPADNKTPAKAETPAASKVPATPKEATPKETDKKPEDTNKKDDTKKKDEKGKTSSLTIPPARRQARVSRSSRTVLAAFEGKDPEKKDTDKKDTEKKDQPAKTDTKAAEKAAAKPADAKPAETKPADPKPGESKPADKADPKAPVTTPAAPPANAAAADKGTAPAVIPPVIAPFLPNPLPGVQGGDLPALPPKKYRPLSEVKEEIRKDIIKNRAFEEIQKESDLILADLRKAYGRLDQKFQLIRIRPGDDRTALIAAAEAEMKKIEAKYKLTFGSTPNLLNSREFRDLAGIGQAMEIVTGNFPRSLTQQLFMSEDTFGASQAEDVTTGDHYYFWKIEHKPAHVPEFTEPGIKAKVLEEWKLEQARPLAKKRADELVSILSKSTKSAAETLGKSTITGQPNASQITVLNIPSFTWMSTPSAQSGTQSRQFNQVQPTTIPQLPKASDEFMKLVYYELKPGEWGEAPAFDNSAYYVVKLDSRRMPKMEELMETPLFASPDLLSFTGPTPYDQLSTVESSDYYRRLMKQLQANYDVVWVKSEESAEPTQQPSDDFGGE